MFEPICIEFDRYAGDGVASLDCVDLIAAFDVAGWLEAAIAPRRV